MEIRIYSDPILKKKCKPVEEVSDEVRSILRDMAQTMYQAQGIGLAAPQVGIERQMIVVDVGDGLISLINPKIAEKEGRSILEEGCLSLPGIIVKVKRAKKVVVQGLDGEGKPISIAAEGLRAHALQHEIDHLKGVLIVDYMGWKKKMVLRRKLKELKRKRTEQETARIIIDKNA